MAVLIYLQSSQLAEPVPWPMFADFYPDRYMPSLMICRWMCISLERSIALEFYDWEQVSLRNMQSHGIRLTDCSRVCHKFHQFQDIHPEDVMYSLFQPAKVLEGSLQWLWFRQSSGKYGLFEIIVSMNYLSKTCCLPRIKRAFNEQVGLDKVTASSGPGDSLSSRRTYYVVKLSNIMHSPKPILMKVMSGSSVTSSYLSLSWPTEHTSRDACAMQRFISGLSKKMCFMVFTHHIVTVSGIVCWVVTHQRMCLLGLDPSTNVYWVLTHQRICVYWVLTYQRMCLLGLDHQRTCVGRVLRVNPGIGAGYGHRYLIPDLAG